VCARWTMYLNTRISVTEPMLIFRSGQTKSRTWQTCAPWPLTIRTQSSGPFILICRTSWTNFKKCFFSGDFSRAGVLRVCGSSIHYRKKSPHALDVDKRYNENYRTRLILQNLYVPSNWQVFSRIFCFRINHHHQQRLCQLPPEVDMLPFS